MKPTERLFQGLLVGSVISLSWLGMMAVHEFGHVLHAWLSGGAVLRVVLDPIDLSHTELRLNPHPVFVAWGGVVWGSLLPLGLAPLVRDAYRYLVRFFAGFCCVANGAYLVAGVFTNAGDPGDLLRAGVPGLVLICVGTAAASVGLILWNGLGGRFGLGPDASPVDRRAALGLVAALAVLVAVELGFTR